MRHKHRVESKKFGSGNAFDFSLSTLSAQKSVPATGGNASGSGGSTSYCVGQVVYTTNTGTNGTVAQ